MDTGSKAFGFRSQGLPFTSKATSLPCSGPLTSGTLVLSPPWVLIFLAEL